MNEPTALLAEVINKGRLDIIVESDIQIADSSPGVGLFTIRKGEVVVLPAKVSVVPWCAEHNSPLMNGSQRLCDFRYANQEKLTPCRLEEPARHIVLREQR